MVNSYNKTTRHLMEPKIVLQAILRTSLMMEVASCILPYLDSCSKHLNNSPQSTRNVTLWYASRFTCCTDNNKAIASSTGEEPVDSVAELLWNLRITSLLIKDHLFQFDQLVISKMHLRYNRIVFFLRESRELCLERDNMNLIFSC